MQASLFHAGREGTSNTHAKLQTPQMTNAQEDPVSLLLTWNLSAEASKKDDHFLQGGLCNKIPQQI